MVGRSTGVERLVCFRWFHSLVEVEGPVVDTRAGCSRWLQVKELLQTRGLVVLDVASSGTGYAVHALKDNLVFSLLNGEIWIPVGLVVPWWSSFGTAFVDAGAGCPAAVSGRETCSKLEGRLPSVDRSRNFCRHGGRLPCSGLGFQGLL